MIAKFKSLSDAVRQYLLITANYWVFTLTDGALRMLVVLYFYQLGYDALSIAMLFIFYEAFGVVTNLVGGWLGARFGLNRTMQVGALLQIIALLMLAVPDVWLGMIWVMAAQALSGIAKDLNKMSAKSAIKLLIPAAQQGRLYRWVALLTGSKNTLKGVGFFIGGVLLATVGFQLAVTALAAALALMALCSWLYLRGELGTSSAKPKFREVFSTSRAINLLSAARLFLFAARDIWFVVAIPVYFSTELDWGNGQVGSFMALWIIGYGVIQALVPHFKLAPNAVSWALVTMSIPTLIVAALNFGWPAELSLIIGLLAFAIIFAINSALHSYLIVSYARADGVSLDVGFYYMANALGRLLGTLLSGALYQSHGLTACLIGSAILLALSAICATGLPRQPAIKNGA
ncbi:organoarsenical effux MFS transporter ArsJ [Pseudidiomarina taiwanensis]|uniref:MFS transporter n=1 Tax=Pseudidiomarina taiwanensis TaxID=337250 RepID=A0A432ZCN7_9GAMM|nr:organoarsenical effux MFS transporter ArsJ [Pseudidiomarina taiwanensis]RUO75706.1 MFS transporter [Pseudidiomarina taiwanensis]